MIHVLTTFFLSISDLNIADRTDIPDQLKELMKNPPTAAKCSSSPFHPKTDCASSHDLTTLKIKDKLEKKIRLHKSLTKLYSDISCPAVIGGEDIMMISKDGKPFIEGEGTYASVFLGLQKSTGQYVALKLFQVYDQRQLKSVLTEWGIQSKVYDKTKCTPQPLGFAYLNPDAMERLNVQFSYVSISTFASVIPSVPVAMSLHGALQHDVRPSPIFTPVQWVHLLQGIVSIIENLSRVDIYHGDIKSDNFMIEFKHGNPEPLLIDFGLSLHKDENASKAPVCSKEDIAEHRRIAPELATLTRPLPTSDMYSGMVLIRNVLKTKTIRDSLDTAAVIDMAEAFCQVDWTARPSLDSAVSELREKLRQCAGAVVKKPAPPTHSTEPPSQQVPACPLEQHPEMPVASPLCQHPELNTAQSRDACPEVEVSDSLLKALQTWVPIKPQGTSDLSETAPSLEDLQWTWRPLNHRA